MNDEDASVKILAQSALLFKSKEIETLSLKWAVLSPEEIKGIEKCLCLGNVETREQKGSIKLCG